MTLRVTDHALVRYLERVMKLDVESVRDHIRDVCSQAAELGGKRVKAEGATFELSKFSGSVVTVKLSEKKMKEMKTAELTPILPGVSLVTDKMKEWIEERKLSPSRPIVETSSSS